MKIIAMCLTVFPLFLCTAFAQSPYEGKLIKGNDQWKGVVWIVLHGARHHIINPEVFNACGFDWNSILTLGDSVVTSIQEKARITAKSEYEIIRDNPDYMATVFVDRSSTPGISASVSVCRASDGKCTGRNAGQNPGSGYLASLGYQAANELNLRVSQNSSRLIIAGKRNVVHCNNCIMKDADTPTVTF